MNLFDKFQLDSITGSGLNFCHKVWGLSGLWPTIYGYKNRAKLELKISYFSYSRNSKRKMHCVSKLHAFILFLIFHLCSSSRKCCAKKLKKFISQKQILQARATVQKKIHFLPLRLVRLQFLVFPSHSSRYWRYFSNFLCEYVSQAKGKQETFSRRRFNFLLMSKVFLSSCNDLKVLYRSYYLKM